MTKTETTTLDDDITVFYITANSYPAGIMDAHQQLHALVPFSGTRRYFGLSRPEKGGTIVYRAAAEELESGEAEKYHCETLIIKKGNYISLVIQDYLKDLQAISKAFRELLQHPRLDPQGYCVEYYLNEKDVQCMVRLEK